MKFSQEQEEAIKEIMHWYQTGDEQVFKLFGYAGSGKTTLIKHIAKKIGGEVRFGAFTGKAASVMKAKGCTDAMTIHQMIYRSKGESTKELEELLSIEDPSPQTLKKIEKIEYFLANPVFERKGFKEVKFGSTRLIIIDEVSMVDSIIGTDLISFGIPILVVGDEAQLPPIGKNVGFFNNNPDVKLTGIHRQKENSHILDLATQARNKEMISPTITEGLSLEQMKEYDQILVGTNATRHGINAFFKQGEPLDVGDKLVCLKNNYVDEVLNGTIWYVKTILEEGSDYYCVNLTNSEREARTGIKISKSVLAGGEMMRDFSKTNPFNYGFAITVHKAQGSQFDNVLIFNESSKFRKDRHKWMYTAITRAAKNVEIAIC